MTRACLSRSGSGNGKRNTGEAHQAPGACSNIDPPACLKRQSWLRQCKQAPGWAEHAQHYRGHRHLHDSTATMSASMAEGCNLTTGMRPYLVKYLQGSDSSLLGPSHGQDTAAAGAPNRLDHKARMLRREAMAFSPALQPRQPLRPLLITGEVLSMQVQLGNGGIAQLRQALHAPASARSRH